jgi:uncharacterized RDD family membrane protein YckC
MPQTRQARDTADDLQGHYAGFVSRAIALLIDYAIIVVTSVIMLAAVSIFFNLPTVHGFIQWLDSWLPGSQRLFELPSRPLFGASFISLCYLLYFVFFLSTTGQTIGKAVLGLRVVTLKGARVGVKRALIRTVCYAVSLAPLGLGFLWVLGHDQRQAWHDRIARTYVLYVWEARYEENFLRSAVYRLTRKHNP